MYNYGKLYQYCSILNGDLIGIDMMKCHDTFMEREWYLMNLVGFNGF